MLIKQFYDSGLAHASYAIISNSEMMVIDPARNPKSYYDFAEQNQAKIAGVIETHPHADFVSSHLEIHQKTGAVIYVSKLVNADYPHKTFDEGDIIPLGKIQFKAINTPGHSPDSISVLLLDENRKEHAVFTGDTLFAGDVGRPDLRENTGNLTAKKEELAKAMYRSTRQKLMKLPENVLVYPAHGPGSLCGKSMNSELYSTIGNELRNNYALQLMGEMEFVKKLTENQPFIPKYFGYNVDLNKQGAAPFGESVNKVPRLGRNSKLEKNTVIVDTRPQHIFKKGHVKGAFNLQNGLKFETWLGSVIAPGEPFYLIAGSKEELEIVISKTAKIGYEKQVKGALLTPENSTETSPEFDLEAFNTHRDQFTIVDIRNKNEVTESKLFKNAIAIPLPELRERSVEIPTDKPIAVHCAGGYRSAAGASIVAQQIPGVAVLDISEAILNFPVN